MTDDFEKIGYGQPPKKYRFKKGQSGNPGGRPKWSKDTGDVVLENMGKRMPARVNGRSITTNVHDAVIKAQIKKALDGDTKAAKFLIDLLHHYEARKYYMETAINFMNKQMTKALRKQGSNPRAARTIFDDARHMSEVAIGRYEDECGG